MTKTLVSGGTGYIASHIVQQLLERKHTVVTTVRTTTDADKLKARYSDYTQSGKFDAVIVEDVTREGAFDKAIVSEPPFEAVIHPTSPFFFEVDDIQKQLLDPAIRGTTGILKSIHQYAPTVTRVVITSSLAAMIHPWEGSQPGNWPGHVYSELDWNPITPEQAFIDSLTGYRASKKQAEQAAWKFVADEKPNFTLTTICPPLVLGPTISTKVDPQLSNVNESLRRVRDMVNGTAKANNKIPPNGAAFIFTDVRDAAKYHVLSLEKPEAENKRFFIPTGWFSNRDILKIIHNRFPELKETLPPVDAPGPKADYPEDGMYTVDASSAAKVFPEISPFRVLEDCIIDTVKSFQVIQNGTEMGKIRKSDSGVDVAKAAEEA